MTVRDPEAMQPHRRRPGRRAVLLAVWLAAGIGVVARAFQIQIVQGPEWRILAEQQHRKAVEMPAPRGTILDREGVPLAESHESWRVSVAPHELADRDSAAALLRRFLDLPPERARRVTRSTREWVVLPGRYPAEVESALSGTPGIYVRRELERFYPYDGLARALLGTVEPAGGGAGGVEEAFDSVLAGTAGRKVLARDARNRPIPGEAWIVRKPRPGRAVVLTIDIDLQEIGHEALREAVEATGARGGDLIIGDPATGEILALVSLGGEGRQTLSALTTPYEPGSTMKPFTVAALRGEGLATLRDSVDTADGVWTAKGRTIRDVHPHGTITLAHALRVSSNIGVARMASALPEGTHYEYLRDFGFGSPTGLPIPGEASGTLRRPDRWSAYSQASVSIGYEVAVTPVQMVMAYGALANGGVLMEPRIVREVRGREPGSGRTLDPRPVRRVVPRSVAGEIADVLVDAVADGSGQEAGLATFQVAGKTGTARYYSPEGGYESGSYLASFVGFFPAESPQLVVFVKLDRPDGAYYGGLTAAPVTRSTLEAILATRRAPMDRRALASASVAPAPLAGRPAPFPVEGAVRFAALDGGADPGISPGGSRVPGRVIRPATSGSRAPASDRRSAAPGGVPVPDVSGIPTRTAVRRLHARGLRVSWSAPGRIVATRPRAGARVSPGDTVELVTAGEGGR